MNILIIDDDRVDRLTVRELLADAYSVIEARSADEFQKLLGGPQIDCVLLDYLIPGTDSLQLLSELSAQSLPVIMLTGEGDETVAVQAMKLGALDYLSKRSLNSNLLRRAISKAIDTAALKEQLAAKQAQLVSSNSQLTQKVRELQRVTADLENLIHIAAHDLREPIKNLCCYCDLVERKLGTALETESLEHLSAMRRSAKRLALLIDDLRALSRVSYDSTQSEPVALSELVRSVLAEFTTELDTRSVTVVVAELPTVTGFKFLLAELFTNLITNALKYGPARSMRLTVTHERKNGKDIFGVWNSGSLIPIEDIGKVFQPFYRAEASRKMEGTGMGLTLCRKIVERHGGTMWIESAQHGAEQDTYVHAQFTLGE